MDTNGLAEFLKRDWAAVAREKQRFWNERLAGAPAEEGLRIAEELRAEALSLNPGWPSAEDRADDLRAHEALSEKFRRASNHRPG